MQLISAATFNKDREIFRKEFSEKPFLIKRNQVQNY
jgi:hypothetical protein